MTAHGDHHIDALIVGAGFGGIGAAIQLDRLGYRDIVIVDREDDLGGTWHVNRYPGLAVDVPSTTYSYWFEPNPYWSRLYAPGEELKRYAELVADKYDVRRFMRFNTTVESARWDDEAELWRVTVDNGETLSTRYLIVATGFLCQPRTPDIPGIESFAGCIIHAADWDDSHSIAGQRTAIIGTGSTGVQLIPELAKEAAELIVYQRTPIWVLPKIDFGFAPSVRRLFAKVPAAQRVVRWMTDTTMDVVMLIAMWKFRYFKGLNRAASTVAKLHQFLVIRDKDVRRKLTPDYDYGCKRPTLSNSYYRTFAQPHVCLETAGIDRIEPDGIVTLDGREHRIDTLVLATGFDVWEANLPAIEVIGRDGRNLGKWWRENRFQAYEGLAVPGFPNFLNSASPYAWVGLSWFNTVEYQMRHMNRLFGELQRRGAQTFEVTEEANARFLDRMTELLEDSVFLRGNCATSRSYWFNHSGEAPLFRPTSARSAVKAQDRFPMSDYAIA
ncbi:flavin-containing monooxygenase [Mycolicibacterium baixiangningiae]|uniref:flavin-containing monooxygenase n=1 Tax=Mycolicibacterium baixiangningiae TaxID=2761578 RepID=UPI001E311D74|nr:NAD(P)/FAD-dependent oxidoreductase [Mycolicibacterium baixiangningiae]